MESRRDIEALLDFVRQHRNDDEDRLLLSAGKYPETVCGWTRNIGREGQEKKLLSLQELREETVDMFTTVFIGAESTKNLSGWMVTPRGYERKCRS